MDYEQKNIELAFEKIISSVSDMDLIMPAPAKDREDEVSSEEYKKIIASFARYIALGHPGFADSGDNAIAFSDETKLKIKENIVHLYLTEKHHTISDVEKELFTFSKKYIPDNHFNVFTSQGELVGAKLSKEEHLQLQQELQGLIKQGDLDTSQQGVIEHLYTQHNQVGKNVFHDEAESLLEQQGIELTTDAQGKTWKIGHMQYQDKKVMVIGMSKFAAIDKNGFSVDLIHDFTALATEFSKQPYLQADVLMLDLRGNGGGWPYIGDYMARTLYGNTISTEPQSSLKMDSLEAKLSFAYMEQRNILERKALLDSPQQTQYKNRDISLKHPFNSELGYNKPILVLTDRHTGSNAELTIGRLKQHPFVRVVGDNSCGVVQYKPAATGKTAIPLPYGIRISVPPVGESGPNGEKLEGIGFVPDYRVKKGDDALLFGLERLDDIISDIQEKLPAPQQVKTQALYEDRVKTTTSMCQKSMANNPQCLSAFNKLVAATTTIPQLAKLTGQRKNLDLSL
ncbi:MAG: hypothetical protein J6C85_05310 [Alphaproteobacteria bacterium]|nr:hypothetical protein [Alphaproteobacteria bacterium]